MGDTLEYNDVLQEVRGTMNPGRLKLQSNNVIFKNIKSGRVDQFASSEIDHVNWLIRARGYCLKFRLQNGNVHRYDGLKESELEKLTAFIRTHYGAALEKKDVSVKGWNWGVANFIGNSIEFDVNKNIAFEVPLNNVSQSRVGKNEITLEFHQNDDAAVSLMELRFHIPPDQNAEKDPVEEFHENVVGKADIIQATGDALAIFQEIQCLTPRGRYDIKFFPSFIQLHGKTFDFKIPLAAILRLFLLPHKDGRQMFFVVSLDPPIKQGQTRYHFLILLFNKDEEMTIEFALTESEVQEKFQGKLSQEMSGPTFEIISRVMKAFVNRKITVPGSFMGNSGTHAISCSFKAATGHLYPLERGFIFVHKPPVHIRFDEIAHVNFSRSTGNTRSFDFDVETKAAGTMYTFVGIEKDEYGKLYDFVTNKKLRVKNIGGKLPGSKQQVNYEEMDSSDDEGHHDAYLERMKAEGKERDEDDDSDESTDDTFNPDNESGSSVAEEYDSDIQSTTGSGSSDSGTDSKEKKKAKPKKAKTSKEDRKPRKKKSNKDPNAPKRSQTAFFIWLNEHREQIKTETPGISVTDVTKKAGEMWKEITDKSIWEEKAKVEKEKYERAMEEYKKTLPEKAAASPDESDEGSSKKKSKSSKPSPKKSPKKVTGAGNQYKSKEFISTSEDSDDDGGEKSKKKKSKKTKAASDDEPLKKKTKEESDNDSGPDELPSDHEEDVLSSPEKSSAGSDSD